MKIRIETDKSKIEVDDGYKSADSSEEYIRRKKLYEYAFNYVMEMDIGEKPEETANNHNGIAQETPSTPKWRPTPFDFTYGGHEPASNDILVIRKLGEKEGFRRTLQDIVQNGDLDEYVSEIRKISEARERKLKEIKKEKMAKGCYDESETPKYTHTIGESEEVGEDKEDKEKKKEDGDGFGKDPTKWDCKHNWSYYDLESLPPIHCRKCVNCYREEYQNDKGEWIEGKGY